MTSYFTASDCSDADAIAATLPTTIIPAYLALPSAAAKTPVLLQASEDVDTAMRYQGRRYDTITQDTEFPRVAYEPSNAILPNTGAAGIPGGSAFGSTIWDVDPVTLSIVVPARVLLAVIYQADYLAAGQNPDIDDQFSGIKDEKNSSLAKSYGRSKQMETGLCRRSYQLMLRYRLTSGRNL